MLIIFHSLLKNPILGKILCAMIEWTHFGLLLSHTILKLWNNNILYKTITINHVDMSKNLIFYLVIVLKCSKSVSLPVIVICFRPHLILNFVMFFVFMGYIS